MKKSQVNVLHNPRFVLRAHFCFFRFASCFFGKFGMVVFHVKPEPHQGRCGNKDRRVGSHDDPHQKGKRKRMDNLPSEHKEGKHHKQRRKRGKRRS